MAHSKEHELLEAVFNKMRRLEAKTESLTAIIASLQGRLRTTLEEVNAVAADVRLLGPHLQELKPTLERLLEFKLTWEQREEKMKAGKF